MNNEKNQPDDLIVRPELQFVNKSACCINLWGSGQSFAPYTDCFTELAIKICSNMTDRQNQIYYNKEREDIQRMIT